MTSRISKDPNLANTFQSTLDMQKLLFDKTISGDNPRRTSLMNQGDVFNQRKMLKEAIRLAK